MGFIFDFDGTLLDSMKIWETAGEDFLLTKGKTPEEGLSEKFKTFTLTEVAEYYKTVYHLEESIKILMGQMNEFVTEQYRTKTKPKEGAMAFLESNATQKMCIATAADRSMVEMCLEIHGMSKYFSAIFTCNEVGVGKTKPDIYEIALSHLGTKKEETFVFEDALHGIQTAKETGFPVIAVADDSAISDKEKIMALADVYIQSFQELKKCSLLP